MTGNLVIYTEKAFALIFCIGPFNARSESLGDLRSDRVLSINSDVYVCVCPRATGQIFDVGAGFFGQNSLGHKPIFEGCFFLKI